MSSVIEAKKKRIFRVKPVVEKLKQEGQLILGSINSLEEKEAPSVFKKQGGGKKGEREEEREGRVEGVRMGERNRDRDRIFNSSLS